MPELGKATYVVEISTREAERELGRFKKTTHRATADASRDVHRLERGWEDAGLGVRRAERDVRRFNKEQERGGRKTWIWDNKLRQFSNTINALKWPAIFALGGPAIQALASLAAGAVSVSSALVSATGGVVAMGGALVQMARGASIALNGMLGLATAAGTLLLGFNGVAGALSAMMNQYGRSGQEAESSAKAQRSAMNQVHSAIERIRTSEESLAKAHVGVADAQEELHKARREAIRDLVDLRYAAEEGRLSERQAILALDEARESAAELAKRGSGATADEQRGAILSIEQAELGLRKSRTENKRSQEDLQRGERRGVRNSEGVVSARKALIEANRNVSKTERALVQSEHNLVEQQKDAAEAMNKTGRYANTLAAKMKLLPPAAKKFVHFLWGMKPKFEELQEVSAAGMFPGMEHGLTAAMGSFERLKKVIGLTAGAIGHTSEEMGRLVGSKGFGSRLQEVGESNARIMRMLGRASVSLTDAFSVLAKAGAPLNEWLGGLVKKWAEQYDAQKHAEASSGRLAKRFSMIKSIIKAVGGTIWNFGHVFLTVMEAGQHAGLGLWRSIDKWSKGLREGVESVSGRKSLSAYFERSAKALRLVGKLFMNLLGTVVNVGSASRKTGMELLRMLNHAAEGWKKWTESFHGKNEMKAYFEHTKPDVVESGRLVAALGSAIVELNQRGTVAPLLRELRVKLLPALTELIGNFTSDLAPAVINVLVELMGIVGQLSKASGGLSAAFQIIAGGLRIINGILQNPILRQLASWTLAFAALAKAGLMVREAFLGSALSQVMSRIRSIGAESSAAAGEMSAAETEKTAAVERTNAALREQEVLMSREEAVAMYGPYAGNKYADKQGLPATTWRGKYAGAKNMARGIPGRARNVGRSALGFARRNSGSIIGGGLLVGGSYAGSAVGGTAGSIIGGAATGAGLGAMFAPESLGLSIPIGAAAGALAAGIGALTSGGSSLGKAQKKLIGYARRVNQTFGEATSSAARLTEAQKRVSQAGDEEHHATKRLTKAERKLNELRHSNHKDSHAVVKAEFNVARARWSQVQALRKLHASEEVQRAGEHATRASIVKGYAATKLAIAAEEKHRKHLEERARTEGWTKEVTEKMGKTIKRITGYREKEAQLTKVAGQISDGFRKKVESMTSAQAKYGRSGVVLTDQLKEQREKLRDMKTHGLDYVGSGYQQLRDEAHKTETKLQEFLRNTSPKLAKFSETGSTHIKGLSGAFEGMSEATREALEALGVNVNKILLKLGVDKLAPPHLKHLRGRAAAEAHHHMQPGNPFTLGRQRGGHIDMGAPAGDSVPAMLEKDEYVLNRKAVRKVGVHNLDRLNFGEAPRFGFQQGGFVISEPQLSGGTKGLREAGQSGVHRATKAARHYVNKFWGGKKGIGGLQVKTGPIQQMARTLVSRTFGPGQWNSFNALEMGEAGWDPHAQNPESTAYGLAQNLYPATYPPAGRPGSRAPLLEQAKAQLQWMVRYIKERYGDPKTAYATWLGRSPHWYQRGGRVRGYQRGGRVRLQSGGQPTASASSWSGVGAGGLHTGIHNLASYVMSKFGGLSVTSTTGGEHEPNSYHYKGEAVDLANSSTSYMDKAAGWISGNLTSALTEGIHNPDLSVKYGKGVPSSYWGPETWAGHKNHIHLAVDHPWSRPSSPASGSGASAAERGFTKPKEKLPDHTTAKIPTGGVGPGKGGHAVAGYSETSVSTDKVKLPPLPKNAMGCTKQIASMRSLLNMYNTAAKQTKNEPAKRAYLENARVVRGRISALIKLRAKFIRSEKIRKITTAIKRAAAFEYWNGGELVKEGLLEQLEKKWTAAEEYAGRVTDLEPTEEADALSYIRAQEEPAYKAVLGVEGDWRNALVQAKESGTQKAGVEWPGKITDLRGKVSHQKDRIKEITEKIKEILGYKKDHPEAWEKQKGRIPGLKNERDDLRGKIEVERATMGALREAITQTYGETIPDWESMMEGVQGASGPWGVIAPLPASPDANAGFGGDIWATQMAIRDLGLRIKQGESQSAQKRAEEYEAFNEAMRGLLAGRPFLSLNFTNFMGAHAKGGVALVGEKGPELAHMPHGTRITDAEETARLLKPQVTVSAEGLSEESGGDERVYHVDVTNNFPTPPADPHTWAKQQEYELGALA